MKRLNISQYALTNIQLVALILAYPWFIAASIVYYVVKLFKKSDKNVKIEGEVAVITGSGGGLGRELAIELAKRGCHIAIVDVQQTLAEETAKQIAEKYNVKTKAYKTDVSDFQQVVELEAKVTKDLGHTTILINNAGVLMLSSVIDPPAEEVSRMINVNLTAICYTTQIFLPKMKQFNRGHIVNISSLSALICLPHFSIYGATKLAVRRLTSMLRMELMLLRHNITATTVMPSFLNTNKNVEKLCHIDNLGSRVNLIDGDSIAQEIIQGMLRGEDEIVVPASSKYVYLLLELLPTYIRERLISLLIDGKYQKFIKSSRISKILTEETAKIDPNSSCIIK